MKRVLRTSLMIAAAAVYLQNPAHAQLAKQNLTAREINEKLGELVRKDDAASKAQLLKEAKALASAKNESFNFLAAAVYRQLGDEKTADKISNGLAKKYPKGSAARTAEMQKIFENETASVDQKKAAYDAWVKKFPSSSFAANEQQIYATAAGRIATELAKANRFAEVNALVQASAGTPQYYNMVSSVSGALNRAGQAAQAVTILSDAAKAIENEKEPNRTHQAILGQYAQTLVHAGKGAEGIALAEKLGIPSRRIQASDAIWLAKGYEQMGRNLDAFQMLEGFVLKTSLNEDVLNAIQPLYTKLNNNKGDFAAYKAALATKMADALKLKYKADMIERDAPSFTLTNMQGETVRLEDYRGKFVILDFWATWCGPCVVSFPGMQAAVNKYADDPEVEFLFINTWQREPNYKELVTDFIAKNEYSFHVLYDEMVDREKATVTAYGVRGIPTKVFIDQNGKIRFQSAGGSADVGVVVGEMDAKINLMKEAAKAAAAAQGAE